MLKFKNPLIPLDLNNVQYIVIHHAKAKTASPEDIHKWHLENGWSGAGYNEYIRKDGSVHIMRGDNIGAHCEGYNSKSYGICLEGDYDVEEIPAIQLQALIKRIKFNQARMKNATVVPHKKLVPTVCPGNKFPWERLIIGITMPILKFGSKGDGVSFLQTQLKAKGYACGKADGLFGAMTKIAVIKYQADNKITSDGIVGLQTWSLLLNK